MMSKQPLNKKEEHQEKKTVKDALNLYNSIRRLPYTTQNRET